MKILKCLMCSGELDVISAARVSDVKVKCRKCGFTNSNTRETKEPEIFTIIRKSVNV